MNAKQSINEQTDNKILMSVLFDLEPLNINGHDWYDGYSLFKAGLPFNYGAHGNGTDEIPFKTDWNWLYVAVQKSLIFDTKRNDYWLMNIEETYDKLVAWCKYYVMYHKIESWIKDASDKMSKSKEGVVSWLELDSYFMLMLAWEGGFDDNPEINPFYDKDGYNICLSLRINEKMVLADDAFSIEEVCSLSEYDLEDNFKNTITSSIYVYCQYLLMNAEFHSCPICENSVTLVITDETEDCKFYCHKCRKLVDSM